MAKSLTASPQRTEGDGLVASNRDMRRVLTHLTLAGVERVVMAVCIDDVTEGGFGLGDRLGSAAAIGCVAAPALAILQAIGTRAENARPTTKEAIVVAGTCSSTSRPRAPTTSRASPATRSSSACAAAGGRAPTKPNAPSSPTRSRCGRTRSCRTSMAGSGSVHGGADECLRAGEEDAAGVGAGDASSWTVLTAPLNISGLQDIACRSKPLAGRRSAGLTRATVSPHRLADRPAR